jgi:hypothetical protein
LEVAPLTTRDREGKERPLKDWGCSSVVQHLLSMRKALDSTICTTGRKERKERKKGKGKGRGR